MPDPVPGSDRGRPQVFTIPVHRNFADALVNGLLAQHGRTPEQLARGMVILPSNRAVRAVRDAFVRRAEPALLLPRLVAIGEAGEDAPGLALDTAGEGPLPPAIEPMLRRFMLARLVQQARAETGQRTDASEALRLGNDLGGVIDELQGEEIAPERLRTLDVGPELSVHWQKSLDLIAMLLDRWPGELARLGRIDLAERRGLLLRQRAAAWSKTPPVGWVVAAGITTMVRPVAALLRTIARLPRGSVVLPGVDLASPEEEWDAIAQSAIEGHPQYQLRLLLDRMGVARSDVARWRWGDGRARQAVRARAVSNAFAPARFTAKWQDLPAAQRRLPGVRLAEFATLADEAQGIAIALREAIETPQRTAALVTPDRALATRVAAHLRRWGIEADDSAGRVLSITPPGTLVLGIVQMAVERFAPVPLLTVLKHPLVRQGDVRLAWLDSVRALDRDLRGPRPAPGLSSAILKADAALKPVLADVLGSLEAAFAVPNPDFGSLVDAVRIATEALAGDAAWRGPAGRAASDLCTALAGAAGEGPRDFSASALEPMLRDLMDGVAVRPVQGGHPRIAIWGLIEARLQSADLLVLGGMNEGSWPATPAPDPWLAPRVRSELGLGGLERRIGIMAHDLATHLGGRDVILTRSRRDARSPAIASRFLLRLQAMLGGIPRDDELVRLASAIDASDALPAPVKRPAPCPPLAARPKAISVTDVDRLKADPFAFYAKAILKLRALEPVDADAAAAWRGSQVHAIFDRWFKDDALDPAMLHARVDALFADPATHPQLRAFWAPRLREALTWIAAQVAADRAKGREPIASEISGSTEIAGVRLHGVADRIDRDGEGLAIVDYKTGKPPSAAAVAAGFSMQLGLLGLIAARGGVPGIEGTPTAFEYWSLVKDKDSFGKRVTPAKPRSALTPENFVATATSVFTEVAGEWLTGHAPFTAKLHPEYANYGDYDQLMRLQEWYGRER
ncbi:MAG: PD-(D/E)XK nuclease family protein [Sphingomonadaceae bacterium]